MEREKRMKSVKIELGPVEGNVEKPKPELKLLFIDLNQFSTLVQFLICSSGVFFFYLIYAYFQVLKSIYCESFRMVVLFCVVNGITEGLHI